MKIESISDQDFFVLHGGEIITAHGWTHPPGHIVGELVFVPDKNGDRLYFGKRYRKAYVKNGRGQSELDRTLIRSITGTFFDYAHPFTCKSIIRYDQVEHQIKSSWSRVVSTNSNSYIRQYLKQYLAEMHCFLGKCLDDVIIGLTGSLSLSLENNFLKDFHDIDITFTGDIYQVCTILKTLRSIAIQEKECRVHEYGKGWQTRLRTKTGLLCAFVLYKNAIFSPLNNIKGIKTLIAEIELKGKVVDDCHGGYLPTILTIEIAEEEMAPLPHLANRQVRIIISHMRSRGDFSVGSFGLFKGALLLLETDQASVIALSVVDAGCSKLLTPPWTPY